MAQLNSFLRIALLAGAILFVSSPTAQAREKWDPIPPEDLRATDCRYYPGASAEALFIRLALNGANGPRSERSDYYKRIKIYSAKGAAELGVLSIERNERQQVWNYVARVTKPDGRSTEYGKDSFTETVSAKFGQDKYKRLVLAVPDLATGDIVELQWSISIDSYNGSYYWWYAQLDIPVRQYSFRTEALARDYTTMWFNVAATTGKKGAKGAGFDLEMNYLLPFKEDPFMPPEQDCRGWFLIMFRDVGLRGYEVGNEMFKALSGYWDDEFKRHTKPDPTIKAKAAELTAGLTDETEKLHKLYEFCRLEIDNLSYEDSPELQAAQKKLDKKGSQVPRETLANRNGYPEHITELFGALARAAGFDVAHGRAASRNRTLNVQNPNGWLFLQDEQVFVRTARGWLAFAPGDYLVPAGMLDVSNQGVPSLRCMQDRVVFETTPLAKAAESLVTRKARATLDAEGNLQADIEITLTGYPAIRAKSRARGKQQEEVEKEYREKISQALPSAEVTGFEWGNLRNQAYPVTLRYKLSVPAYADAIGSKLVLPLNLFEHNQPAVFVTDERTYNVVFDHARQEHDEVVILVPEGSRLEAPTAPPVVGNVDAELGVAYRVEFKPKTHTIKYQRDFSLGADGTLTYERADYPKLKARLDRLHRSDEHTLVLVGFGAAADEAVAAKEEK